MPPIPAHFLAFAYQWEVDSTDILWRATITAPQNMNKSFWGELHYRLKGIRQLLRIEGANSPTYLLAKDFENYAGAMLATY